MLALKIEDQIQHRQLFRTRCTIKIELLVLILMVVVVKIL